MCQYYPVHRDGGVRELFRRYLSNVCKVHKTTDEIWFAKCTCSRAMLILLICSLFDRANLRNYNLFAFYSPSIEERYNNITLLYEPRSGAVIKDVT